MISLLLFHSKQNGFVDSVPEDRVRFETILQNQILIWSDLCASASLSRQFMVYLVGSARFI